MPIHRTSTSVEPYRRSGTAQRELTLAPVVPSQDATRYQAQHVPPPKYDLAQKNEPLSTLAHWVRALAPVTTAVAIMLFRRRSTSRHT